MFSLLLHMNKNVICWQSLGMYEMRKFFLSILLAAILMAISCRHEPTLQEMGIALDTLRIDTTAVLSDSATQAHCNIKLQILTFANKEYAKINDSLVHSDILSPEYLSLTNKPFTPREAIDSFIRRYIDDYRTFYKGIYTDEATEEAATIGFTASTSMEVGKDSLINYLAQVSNNQGSISTDYTVCLNLDLAHQRILRLSDVFVHGAEKGLTDAIVKRLMKQASVSSLDALRQAGFFVNSAPYPTENFILKEHHITFVYVTGEIADRSKGEIRVEVNNSDIKNLFKR